MNFVLVETNSLLLNIKIIFSKANITTQKQSKSMALKVVLTRMHCIYRLMIKKKVLKCELHFLIKQ
jgi:hypothetical protein